MDRFIEEKAEKQVVDVPDLKSNMDRFIVKKIIDDSFKYRNLKSNMDRFIADGGGGYRPFCVI